MSETAGPTGAGRVEDLVGAPEPDRLTERGLASVWRRGRRGAGLFAYWLCLIFVIPSLILTVAAVAAIALGFGAGYGLSVPSWYYYGPALFGAIAAYGLALGGLFGLVSGLIRLVTPRPILGAWVRMTTARKSAGSSAIRLEILPEGAGKRVVRSGRPALYRILAGGLIVSAVSIPAGLACGFLSWKYLEARIARAEAAAYEDTALWRIEDFIESREPMPDELNSSLVADEVVLMLPENWPSLPEGEDPKGPAGEFDRAYKGEWDTEANRRLAPETARAFRGELAQHADAIEMSRSLAGMKSGQHSFELGLKLIDTLLPQSQDARQAPRLLQLDAAIRAEAGDIDGALEDCRAILGAARSIGDEPFAISMLVRMAILTVARQTIERAMAQGEASDRMLQTLQAEVAEERAYPHLLQAMRGERGSTVELIRRLRDGELTLNQFSGGESDGPVRALSGFGQLWFHYQYAVALEWGNENVEIAHGPMNEYVPRWNAFERKLVETARHPVWSTLALMPSKMWPAMASLIDSILRNQAFLATTEVFLAAERYRIATGKWPGSIDELSPKYLQAIPRDPYNGGPLGYRIDSDRLIVHTVGPDLRDNGGAYERTYYKTKGPDDIGITGWLPRSRGLPR